MSSIMVWGARLRRHAESEVRPVIEKRLEAGTVLFRAGEPCSGVALIRDGAVELISEDSGVRQRVGTRGKGACVGGEAVLGAGVCRHTVVAISRTTVEMLARDVFLERFARTAVAAPAEGQGRVAETAPVVHLAPASPESRAALPWAGIEIDSLPFVIGRVSAKDAMALDRERHLLLDDRQPFRLSRRQFVIVATGTGIGLSDPGSRLGTFVDGERLGVAPREILPGQTVEVSAGGPRSPFRFHLRAFPGGLAGIA